MTRVRVARQNDINTWASREFQSSQINCFPRTSRSVFRVAASRFCPTSATRLSSSSVLSFLCSHRTLHLLLLILDWACTGDQVSERRKCSAELQSVRLIFQAAVSRFFATSATSATWLSSSSVLSFLCSHRTLHLLLLILDWACTRDQVFKRRKCSV